MKRIALGLGLMAVGLLMGLVLAWVTAERTIALNWGDGKYGKNFYGAHVYYQPSLGPISVCGRVWIGPGNDYWHDCGVLGQAMDHSEAVANWGQITWKEDGLHIGGGEQPGFFLPRATMESHR